MSKKATKRTQSQAFTKNKEPHPRVAEGLNKKSRTTDKADPIETKTKKEKAKVAVDGRNPLKKRAPRKKKNIDITPWPLLPQDDTIPSFEFPEGSFVFELGELPDYARSKSDA